jgi:hypothetical protein
MVVKIIKKPGLHKKKEKPLTWWNTPEMERVYQGALQVIANHRAKKVNSSAKG